MSDAPVAWPASEPAGRLSVGEIVLDPAAHLVTVGGRALPLALQEFRLLELLMTRVDHVVPSATILESLWGAQFAGDPGTVAVHILRLRKKLDLHGEASRHLRTVRGIGYVLDSTPISEFS